MTFASSSTGDDARQPWQGRNGPLMIAEIGGNHEGDFDYARRLTLTTAHGPRGFWHACSAVVNDKGSSRLFTVDFQAHGGCWQNFKGVERARSCFSAHHPRRVWKRSVSCTQRTYRKCLYCGACEHGGHGGQGRPERGVEKPCDADGR